MMDKKLIIGTHNIKKYGGLKKVKNLIIFRNI